MCLIKDWALWKAEIMVSRLWLCREACQLGCARECTRLSSQEKMWSRDVCFSSWYSLQVPQSLALWVTCCMCNRLEKKKNKKKKMCFERQIRWVLRESKSSLVLLASPTSIYVCYLEHEADNFWEVFCSFLSLCFVNSLYL